MRSSNESQIPLNLEPKKQPSADLETKLTLEQKEKEAKNLVARKFHLKLKESDELYLVPPDAIEGGVPDALLIKLPMDNEGIRYRAERSFRVYFKDGQPVEASEISSPATPRRIAGHP